MDAWMGYLNGGFTEPAFGTITGVPLRIEAIDSNGNTVNIGTVTSDAQGYFKVKWTPPDKEEVYYVTATFDGSKSYYSSWASTDFVVDPVVGGATSPSVSTVPETLSMTTVILAAAIIVVSIVSTTALLKTRKNKGGIQK
jgi:hypothetical protein